MSNILALSICLSCFLLVSCKLDSFMYNPVTIDAYVLSDSVIPIANREEVTLNSEGNRLYGYYIKQPDSLRVKPHHTIIYNHGNKDHIAYHWQRMEYLYRAGFDVFVYDYRGFGRSEGESTVNGLYADALAAWQYVVSRADVDSTLIVAYGFSLGGVPALHQASRVGKPHALILESAFASSRTLVHSGTLLDIPPSYVLEDEMDNLSRIAEISCPVLILHGDADAFIDITANGRTLYDAAHNPKFIVVVQGAGHEEVPTGLGTQTYIDRIVAFVRGN